jgi:integrase/recombinase XerD
VFLNFKSWKKNLSQFAVNALQRTSDLFALGEYSDGTKRNYLQELRYLFTHYPDTRPSQLTEKMAVDYLIYLAKTLQCSKVKTKMATQSFSFFFKHVLKKEYHSPKVLYGAHSSKLPAVMSMEEVSQVITSLKNLKHRTLLSLVYSTGMRLQELCNLKIEHVDSKQMIIKIVSGKGKKDRIVPLSPAILSQLRIYFLQYKPQVYLFNGSKNGIRYSRVPCSIFYPKRLLNLG